MANCRSDYLALVYTEKSPALIYFLIFYNFQSDAATGIVNKLETYNGCILADSVGLGKALCAR